MSQSQTSNIPHGMLNTKKHTEHYVTLNKSNNLSVPPPYSLSIMLWLYAQNSENKGDHIHENMRKHTHTYPDRKQDFITIKTNINWIKISKSKTACPPSPIILTWSLNEKIYRTWRLKKVFSKHRQNSATVGCVHFIQRCAHLLWRLQHITWWD